MLWLLFKFGQWFCKYGLGKVYRLELEKLHVLLVLLLDNLCEVLLLYFLDTTFVKNLFPSFFFFDQLLLHLTN